MSHEREPAPTERATHPLGTTSRSPLRELPDAPAAPASEGVVVPEPEEPMSPAGAALARWQTRWRISTWFDSPSHSALRQAVPAILVGSALAVQKGAGFAWYALVLALVATAPLLLGGRRVRDVVTRLRVGRTAAKGRADARQDLAVVGAAAASLTVLAIAGGWPVVALYAAALVLAACLLTSVIPITWQSQAETAARLGLTTIAVAVVYLAHGGVWSLDVILVGLQLGVLASVLGALQNLRDRGRDLQSGRMTLAAQFGIPVGQYQLALLCLLPFTINLCWLFAGAWGAALLPFFALPLALWVIQDVNQSAAGPILDRIRPRAAAIHLVFALLLAIGLIL